jgi:cytidine deaminase
VKSKKTNSLAKASSAIAIGEVAREVPAKVRALWKRAVEARKRSYSPYSHFAVGAAFASGPRIFAGCNVENASYGGTVCAERVALLKAVSEGVKNFDTLVVVGELDDGTAPCALCLQSLAEFCAPDMKVWLANPRRILRCYRFAELLPVSFGPRDLLKSASRSSARPSRRRQKKRA